MQLHPKGISPEEASLALRSSGVTAWSWNARANVTESTNGECVEGWPCELFSSSIGGIHPEDLERARETYARALRDLEAYEIEYRIFVPGEGSRWFRERGQAGSDSQGTPVLRGVVFDVTSKKLVSEQLLEEQQLKNKLLENSEDCIKVVDTRGRLVTMSPGGLRTMEIDTENACGLVGQSYIDFFSGDDKRAAKEALRNAKEGRKAGFVGYCPTAKGKPRWWSEVLAPLFGTDGRVERILIVSRDITVQKDAVRQLAKREELFRQLAENIHSQVVYMRDLRKDRFTYVNPEYERVWGRTAESLYADAGSFLESIVEEDLPKVLEIMAANKEGRQTEMEYRLRKGDSVRWISDRSFPILDSSGEVWRVAGIAKDVTEERLKREELQIAKNLAEAANRSKSQFLANMSHEIRTPLGAMLGFAELLLEPDQTEVDRVSNVRTILRNGEQLSKVINEILDLSKIESEKLEIERIPFGPGDVVSDVMQLLKLQADEKGLRLSVRGEESLRGQIFSDPTRLRQILINVIGNAIKFTQHGSVEVIVRPYSFDSGRRTLAFEVRDSGPGLSREEEVRLFQPFTQADASMTRKFGGTGLGLTLARRLARLMGGDVALLRSRVGEGSVFLITIEAPEVPNASEPTLVREPLRIGGRLDGLRVLVVDDAPDNRTLIQRFLKNSGAILYFAEDGEQGVAMAFAENVDVVLMDIQMPRMDGYQAIRCLRERGFEKPVIALTAHAMKGDRETSLASGFDDHLVKPIDRNALLADLSRLARIPKEKASARI